MPDSTSDCLINMTVLICRSRFEDWHVGGSLGWWAMTDLRCWESLAVHEICRSPIQVHHSLIDLAQEHVIKDQHWDCDKQTRGRIRPCLENALGQHFGLSQCLARGGHCLKGL